MASKNSRETFVTDTQTKCCYWLMALHLLCSKYERCHVLNVAENMIFHQVLFYQKDSNLLSITIFVLSVALLHSL